MDPYKIPTQEEQVAQIYKETAAERMANILAGVILFVPLAIIYALFYFFVLLKPYFVAVQTNIRGIIIMAVVIIPLIAVAVLRTYLKRYIADKYLLKKK